MKRHLFLAALVYCALSSALFAQYDVTLDPATARLVYLPGAEGSGVPGGLPDPFMLHFGMNGMLTIEEQGNTGKITLADFVLVGNEAAFQNNPQDRARIEETSRQILLTAMFTVERGPPLDRTLFRADVTGPDLELEFFRQTLVRMDGGPDLPPIDGEGFRYVYPVPEPGVVMFVLAAFGCGGAWWVKSRSRGREGVENCVSSCSMAWLKWRDERETTRLKSVPT
jgi:hypothetical protein